MGARLRLMFAKKNILQFFLLGVNFSLHCCHCAYCHWFVLSHMHWLKGRCVRVVFTGCPHVFMFGRVLGGCFLRAAVVKYVHVIVFRRERRVLWWRRLCVWLTSWHHSPNISFVPVSKMLPQERWSFGCHGDRAELQKVLRGNGQESRSHRCIDIINVLWHDCSIITTHVHLFNMYNKTLLHFSYKKKLFLSIFYKYLDDSNHCCC